MPQIGWSELLVIAVMAILIIGPKDFPIVMSKIASWIKTIKGYANSFQSNLETIASSEEDHFNNDKSKKSKNRKNVSKKTQDGSNYS